MTTKIAKLQRTYIKKKFASVYTPFFFLNKHKFVRTCRHLSYLFIYFNLAS